MPESLSFDAIGTTWQISTNIPLTRVIQKQIDTCIEMFDHSYSRFRLDSFITTLSLQAGEYTLPLDAKALIDLYKTLYFLTKGRFTPLIGQLLVDAGYDSVYSLKAKQLQDIRKWEDVLEYSFPRLILKKPVLLDFGAAGKGYLVDQVGAILKKSHVDTFSINAGGDILQKRVDNKKLRVGLEHPQDSTKVIGVAEIGNESICGSAGNRRAWGKFHHIMNPETKKSVENILAVWVIAESGLVADGLATALFFGKPSVFAKDFSFEYVILKNDYSLDISANFPGEFY